MEQDALLIIKAARFMNRRLVLKSLQEMFSIVSDPFSVSIHNDSGRFWYDPQDESDCGRIQCIEHNEQVNWKSYRGQPEQLAHLVQITFKIDV